MSFASPRRLRTRLLGGVAVGACALAGVAATSGTSEAANGPTMDIQILSFNDFHGNLEPPAGSSGRLVVDHRLDTTVTPNRRPSTSRPTRLVPRRRSAASSTSPPTWPRRAQGHPYSLTVAAGDLIGASPLLSAAFHDEPSIEALNALRLDVSSVGNHEFDEGYKELQRMADGGCIDDGPNGANNQNSCALHPFTGRGLPVPRRQRQVRGHQQHDPSGLHGQEHQGRQDRLHRHDAQGHADDRHRVRRRRSRVHRRGRDRQRARAGAARAGCQRDRRPHPPGRCSRSADLGRA